jgi:hypothetical protein
VIAMMHSLTIKENAAPYEIALTMTQNNTNKRRVFISSVQKELELERIAIASLITTDPFLNEHLEPVLFDKEPISGRKVSKPYLKCLETCNLYLLMINREYGRPHGLMSATHHEYRHAQELGLPTLVFVKVRDDKVREVETRKFFEEIKGDGYTYKRFIDTKKHRGQTYTIDKGSFLTIFKINFSSFLSLCCLSRILRLA